MADPEETEVDAETKEALADELLYGQVATDNERLRGIEAEIQAEIAGFGLDMEAVFSVETAISLAITAASAIWGPKWALVVSAATLGGMVLNWFGLDHEMSAGEIDVSIVQGNSPCPGAKNKCTNERQIIYESHLNLTKTISESTFFNGSANARLIICLLYTSPSPRD